MRTDLLRKLIEDTPAEKELLDRQASWARRIPRGRNLGLDLCGRTRSRQLDSLVCALQCGQIAGIAGRVPWSQQMVWLKPWPSICSAAGALQRGIFSGTSPSRAFWRLSTQA